MSLWHPVPHSKYFYKLELEGDFLDMHLSDFEKLWFVRQDLKIQVQTQLPALQDNPTNVLFDLLQKLLLDPSSETEFKIEIQILNLTVEGIINSIPIKWTFMCQSVDPAAIIYNQFLLPLFGVAKFHLREIERMSAIIQEQQEAINALKEVVKLSGMKSTHINEGSFVPSVCDSILLEKKDLAKAIECMKPTTMHEEIPIDRKSPESRLPVKLSKVAVQHSSEKTVPPPSPAKIVDARKEIEQKKEKAKQKSSNKRKAFG